MRVAQPPHPAVYSAADLRAAAAHAGVHLYLVAAKVPMHPGTLSRLLNGHLPLPEGLAEKIIGICETLTAEGRDA